MTHYQRAPALKYKVEEALFILQYCDRNEIIHYATLNFILVMLNIQHAYSKIPLTSSFVLSKKHF